MANKTDGRRLLGAILAFLGAVSAAYLAYAVVSAAAPTTNPGGQCGGFECILPPQDLVLAAGAILGVPVLTGTLIVGPIVTAVFLRWTRIRGAMACSVPS